MIYKWPSFFKHGRESFEDDPQPRRIIEVTTMNLIRKVEKNYTGRCPAQNIQLAEMFGVFCTTIFKKLWWPSWLDRSSSRWVQRLLKTPQKQMRVECYNTLCTSAVETCMIFGLLLNPNKIPCIGIKNHTSTQEF